jgi:MFS family permease
MGKIFGDVKGAKPLTKRETLQNKYNAARLNLLFAIIFTVINIVLLFVDNSYFLFSIYVPYFIASIGMVITGKMPQEFYAEGWEGTEFLGTGALVVTLVVSAVILGFYLLSWILSKKGRVGWLIFALVIFCIDTLLMLFLQGIAESIIDLVFHIWVIVYLSIGINSHYKLKNLPEEEITQEETTQENAVENHMLSALL